MTGFRLRCGSEVLMVTVVVVALTTTAVSQQFGPFPLGTTIFVDVANTSGIEKRDFYPPPRNHIFQKSHDLD
jgi:hypothetical protein